MVEVRANYKVGDIVMWRHSHSGGATVRAEGLGRIVAYLGPDGGYLVKPFCRRGLPLGFKAWAAWEHDLQLAGPLGQLLYG